MSRIFSALQKIDEARATEILKPQRTGASQNHSNGHGAVVTPIHGNAVAKAQVLEPELFQPRADYRSASLRIAAGPLCPFDGSDPRTAEQYRVLRTNLLLHPAKPRMIAVSSSSPGDGKTVTTLNLAGTFALKSEGNVILVDGDLRKREVATRLGISAEPGLADVLSGNCSLDDAIVRIEEMPNLLVLPSGRVDGNPAELLDSPRWNHVAATLRAHFSYVLIDTTPIAAVADFQLVQQSSDGVVMVLRPDHTQRARFKKALTHIEPKKLLGTVLNAVPDWFLWNTRDHDYYYVESESPTGQARAKRKLQVKK